jgi:SNF2 family DNA or RNA helicase
LTTYEQFKKRSKWFQKQYWPVIVFDEGHKLKSGESETHQIAKKMDCDFKLILTGTPLTNSAVDVYTLLNFLNPGKLKKYKELEDLSNLGDDEINELLEDFSPYILRRNKEQKMIELKIPPKKEIIVEVELTNSQKSLYRAVYERKRSFLVQKFNKKIGESLLSSLKKICNHPFL